MGLVWLKKSSIRGYFRKTPQEYFFVWDTLGTIYVVTRHFHARSTPWIGSGALAPAPGFFSLSLSFLGGPRALRTYLCAQALLGPS